MAKPAAAPRLRRANVFDFVSQSGKTKVTYFSNAPGTPPNGPAPSAYLEYAGPEGMLSFRCSQISRQETPSGQLLSIVLKPQFDAGSLTFSLFVPPVSVAASGLRKFTTCGVKARHVGLVRNSGAQIEYEMESFAGEAKVQAPPRSRGSSSTG